MQNKIFYLGPQTSYCDCAKELFIKKFFNEQTKFEEIAKPTIISVIKALTQSEHKNSFAIMPIENSIQGIVRETLDALLLLKYTDIKIIAEASIPVNHCLIGYASSLSEINEITSHPQAIAQCYNFISDNFEEAISIKHDSSTASAISKLTPDSPNSVAIGSEYSAKYYNIPIIKKDINDMPSNTTRFILLGIKKNKITKQDKTGFSFSTPNSPGALCNVLKILDKYQINMTYIDSRPSKKSLGEYMFYVDIDGHALTENVSKAIFEILQIVTDFQYLGSYTQCK